MTAEKLSVYVDASTMLKLHDIHKALAAVIPGGVSQSKAVCYAIIQTYAAEIKPIIAPPTEEELEAVAKYLPGGKFGDNGRDGE